jgi:hypothetical protein
MTAAITSPRKHKNSTGLAPSKRAKMERAGPTQASLRRLAKKHRPPQSWYDQTDCPFDPAKE